MWGWIAALIKGLVFALREIYGTSEIQKTEVVESEEPSFLKRNEDDLLGELGINNPDPFAGGLHDRAESGNTGGDSAGGRSGSFARKPEDAGQKPKD